MSFGSAFGVTGVIDRESDYLRELHNARRKIEAAAVAFELIIELGHYPDEGIARKALEDLRAPGTTA